MWDPTCTATASPVTWARFRFLTAQGARGECLPYSVIGKIHWRQCAMTEVSTRAVLPWEICPQWRALDPRSEGPGQCAGCPRQASRHLWSLRPKLPAREWVGKPVGQAAGLAQQGLRGCVPLG